MCVDGWENRSLSALADYINGYAFKPDDWGKEGLPIIRIEQLKSPDGPSDYYAGQLPPAVVIDDGDLIFSWSASLFLRIWAHGRAALNQHLFKVVEKSGVDRIFLKAFIEFYLPELTKASHGSTMQHITRKELDRFAAPFPTGEPEQSKIAEVLSTVDRAIAQTEALIAKQQRIKTGLMQDLLTRGIDEHGTLRSEATHAFKDSPLGRIPVEWAGSKLRDLATLNYGRDPRAILDTYGKYPVYGTSGSERLGSGFLYEGDSIILGRKGSIDRVQFAEGRFWTIDTAYFLSDFDGAIPKWLYFFLCSVDLRALNEATGVPSLSRGLLYDIPIPTPPLEEQSRVVDVLSTGGQAMKRIEMDLVKLRSLKTGLMQDLLTGKVRVTPLLEQSTEAVA